ncbi:MAG: hypothetical protein KGL39_31840, partial [Patescibacteria group bacterium]|nr:hypothetical protein [Patescibacteria group bacterium]
MPDNELKISTVVDTTGLQAGMKEAADATAAASEEMVSALNGATTASEALKQAQAELASIVKAAGGSVTQTNALWSVYQDTMARMAILQREVAAASSQQAASVGEAAAAQDALAASTAAAVTATEAESAAMMGLRPRISANSSGIRLMGSAYGNVAVIATVAAAALGVHMADSAMTADLALARLSEQTGISITNLSELEQVGRKVGVSGDTMAQSLLHLQQQVTRARQGSKHATEAFEQLGVSQSDLNDSSLTMMQLIGKISDGLHNQKNSTTAVTAATILLGERGANLATVWRDGDSALRAQMADQQQLANIQAGGVTSAERLQQTYAQLNAVWIESESGILPGFTWLIKQLYLAFDDLATMLDENINMFKGLFEMALHPTKIKDIYDQITAENKQLEAMYKADVAA